MKKITNLIIVVLAIISCNRVEEKTSFKITGIIDQGSFKAENIVLVTQTNEAQDTSKILSKEFEFNGAISEPTNAALIINGKMIKFPLINDEIELEILNVENIEFEIEYKNSQINHNLQTYYNKESKDYIDKYKHFEEQKVKSKDDNKYEIMIAEDSLSTEFIQQLKTKYKSLPDKSGLSIILNDLIGLIGTRNHPEEIEELFKLLPKHEQNGFYGQKIKKYFEQSNKIALGQEIDFDFVDHNKKNYSINEFKGKLVLLEFWASWCGPCISQIPSLKELSKKSDKIQLISISIDDDLNKWNTKIQNLEMNWINIHYKQANIDLKKDFFVSGVPYNILVSQDGKILRKNITMADLKEIVN